MEFLKKMKAKASFGTTVSKLSLLKSEFENGHSSKADLDFMTNYLTELEQQSVYLEQAKPLVKYYSFYRSMLISKLYKNSLADKTKPCLIISSINGNFAEYEEKILEYKQKGDIVVVLGNFIDPTNYDTALEVIRKMMNVQFDEDVVVLKGKNEEDYLNQLIFEEEHPSEEVTYLKTLPTELRTADFSFLNGALEAEDFPLDEIMNNETRNLTDKMIVYINNKENKELFKVNNDERIMSLTDHVAMRLDFTPQ